MENWWRWGMLMALYLPLIAIPVLRPSEGKELRPSDHGLSNQGDEQAKAPQMSSFFGSGVSSTTQPLPEARNLSDPSWSSGGSGGGSADHVRKVLIVSSLVCGIAGIFLLVAAGILFLHRFKNRRSTR
ncbi:uncharacterized protein LOC112513372 [Cynara cardunculus var. scolymus]|uniref:Uncharacterized protein n=1 Tax=Cynara cardunculus var. scolymus TaxID=59895 RepID=A0A103YHM6_CYNCS|nr:uncharacterized protein LOC112513372 [Cynara cardunculus var. scolymus]KVI09235.1 hypothetical protein Ccrd_012386 [Cynara cardunculus var. scolymus]